MDDEDLWSDEINAFVDAAFDSGIVSRNPSDAEEHIAYRYAIKLAIDETRQPQTDALKIAREALEAVREDLRLLMLKQPTTDERDTYSDGFVGGCVHSIGRIDSVLNTAMKEQSK